MFASTREMVLTRRLGNKLKLAARLAKPCGHELNVACFRANTSADLSRSGCAHASLPYRQRRNTTVGKLENIHCGYKKRQEARAQAWGVNSSWHGGTYQTSCTSSIATLTVILPSGIITRRAHGDFRSSAIVRSANSSIIFGQSGSPPTTVILHSTPLHYISGLGYVICNNCGKFIFLLPVLPEEHSRLQ